MLGIESSQGHRKCDEYEKVCLGIDRRHESNFCYWNYHGVLFGLNWNCIKIEET